MADPQPKSQGDATGNVPIIYELDVGMVELKKWHKLDRASLGQIMRRMMDVQIKNPKNSYEIVLDEFFRSKTSELVNAYNKILECWSFEEYEVKLYNLIGKLPPGLKIEIPIRKTNLLSRASMGDMVVAIKQRINFILTRDLPVMYTFRPEYKDAFLKMQTELSEFLEKVEIYEEEFQDVIDKAHNS